MTGEEAIRCLSVHSSTNGSGLCTDEQHYEAKQMGIEAIEQTRWIPVNERLPEEHKKVIVSDSLNGIYIGEFIDREESWGGKRFINEQGMHSKSVIAWMPLPQPYEPQERSDKEMTRRTKGEKEAYLDGFEMCAECIESYLTSAGRQQLERLLVAVKDAVKIEDIEPQESAYDKCPICTNRNKTCQFGSLDCHFEAQIDVAESEVEG